LLEKLNGTFSHRAAHSDRLEIDATEFLELEVVAGDRQVSVYT